MNTTSSKPIYGVTERNNRSYWTRIGTAFTNRDGSYNLLFDFLPTDPKVTIQVRDRAPKDADVAGDEARG